MNNNQPMNKLVSKQDAIDELYASYRIDLAGYTTDELKIIFGEVKHIYTLSKNDNWNNK